MNRVVQAWREVLGAGGDAARFFAGLLGLNVRKSLWVVRGRPGGTAPCQHPSDSGRAGETQCQEAAGWHRPARLRAVCPHFCLQADGRRCCGVDAAAVRPFWGRALAGWAALLLMMWLGGSLAVWAVFWKTGVRTSPVNVVWPGRWDEVQRDRAERYVGLAEQAAAAGRFAEVPVALQSALQVDPKNFRARAMLANIQWVQGYHDLVHEAFAALLRDYPERRAEVARNWMPKLLVSGDYARIKALALTMLAADQAAAGPWAHALVYAARQTDDPVALAEALRLPELPAPLRPVIAAQAAALAGQRETAVRLLSALEAKEPYAQFLAYQQLEGLLELGESERVLTLLESGRLKVAPHDLLYFQLCAYGQLGWGEMSAGAIRGAFRQIDLPRLNAIATYLVRFHDRAGLERVIEALKQAPAAERLDVTFSILYLAAGLWGDRDLMPGLVELAGRKTRLSPRLFERFDAKAREPGRLGEAMGILPIPMESVYAAHRAVKTLAKKK